MKTFCNCNKSSETTLGSFHRTDRFSVLRTFIIGVWLFFPAINSRAALQIIPGHVPPAVASLKSIGSLEPTQRMNLAIELPLRNESLLTNLLHQIYDRDSTNYHHYLVPTQFAEMFGPTVSNFQAVKAFAEANNLEVTYAHSNRLILDVSGRVSDIEKALHVNMHVYQHPTEARTFYAPNAEPSINLAVPLVKIAGLNNFSIPHSDSHDIALGQMMGGQPDAGSGPSGSFTAKDIRNAYLPGVTLTGSGQTVGLLEFDGYWPDDVGAYEYNSGLPRVPLQNVLLDNFNGWPRTAEREVTLDIDMTIAMAPGLSKVIVYEAGPNGVWDDLLNRMADDNLASQLSCSWQADGNQIEDANGEAALLQMAAQGQSFFTASGDHFAYNASNPMTFPAGSPNVTSVGGTMLTTSGTGGYVSETVWNSGSLGSGGGISTVSPIPTWQMGLNMSANGGATTMRNIPDVSLVSYNICYYLWCWDFGWASPSATHEGWGTSFSAPLWAGFCALVNEQAASQSKPPVGFLNPALYAIGKTSAYSSDFHDITSGDNNLFFAVSGYDLCTGWGTPNGQSLIDALTAYDTGVKTQTPILPVLSNGQYVGPGEYLMDGQYLQNTFSFSISGSPNTSWSVYESGDFTHWTFVNGIVLGQNGVNSFSDNTISGVPHRFYKLSNGTSYSTPIGFVNLLVGPGTTTFPGTNALIANPFDASPNDTADSVFDQPPPSVTMARTTLPSAAVLMKYIGSSWVSYANSGQGGFWGANPGNCNPTLAPGEGAFLVNPNSGPLTVTFVGSVRQGLLSQQIGEGLSVVSSQIPVSGGISSVLGLVNLSGSLDGDLIYIWNGAGYTIRTFDSTMVTGFGDAQDVNPVAEPQISIGQAFGIDNTSGKTIVWQQSYSGSP